jgi:hypothetical protein
VMVKITFGNYFINYLELGELGDFTDPSFIDN